MRSILDKMARRLHNLTHQYNRLVKVDPKSSRLPTVGKEIQDIWIVLQREKYELSRKDREALSSWVWRYLYWYNGTVVTPQP